MSPDILRIWIQDLLKDWQEGQSGEDARKCPSCGGRLGLKLAKSGGFIGCSNYPDCGYARPLDPAIQGDSAPGASQAHACIESLRGHSRVHQKYIQPQRCT